MIVGVLALGWIGLSALASPRGLRLVWRLPPAAQAAILLGTAVGLVAIPLSAVIVTLSSELAAMGGTASWFSRCGRLVLAILTDPLRRPELTAALALLGTGVTRLLWGTLSAWRSQSGARALIVGQTSNRLVAPSDQPFAFTAGLLRPRVVVSQGLLASVPAEFRPVVIAHEESHRLGRHPLLIFLAESLARGLPLPPVRRAADGLRLALEAVADDHAARTVGDRARVAEAVAGVALISTEAGAGFEGNEVRRVRRLLDPPAPRPILAALLVVAAVGVATFATGHVLHCGSRSVQALTVHQCRWR